MEPLAAIPLVNLAIVVAMMTGGWIISVRHRNVTIVDSLWGLGFVLVDGNQPGYRFPGPVENDRRAADRISLEKRTPRLH